MQAVNHSGVGSYSFQFVPSEGEAADALREVANLVGCGCVEEIKSISWSLKDGLDAYVLLSKPAQIYPITNECSHTGKEGPS